MQYRVAVATLSGRSYYRITSALKSMDMKYDSLSPEEAAASGARIIITTEGEAALVGGSSRNSNDNGSSNNNSDRKASVMLDTELGCPAVAKAKILRYIHGPHLLGGDQLTVGVDPGSRIGISAIYMHEEIASIVESSPQDAVEQISALLGGIAAGRKVVKIGDGKMAMARQMAWAINKRFPQVEVEIVDEHGTSQNPDANKRGARDRSSARTIAFRAGRKFLFRPPPSKARRY